MSTSGSDAAAHVALASGLRFAESEDAAASRDRGICDPRPGRASTDAHRTDAAPIPILDE